LPPESFNWTVTFDVDVPSAGTDGGSAVITDVAAEAGPTVSVMVSVAFVRLPDVNSRV
jgi:hypothetical protein